MRIGYDASPIRRGRSGVGHYAASLLEALQEIGQRNEYLVFSHLGNPGLRGSNLILTQSRPFPIKELWMQFWLPRLVDRFKPDLCHFTNSIAPLHPRSKYVVTVHDLGLVKHPEWHPWTRRIWMRRLMRPSILGAAGIICVSEATRGALLSWLPYDPGRVWTVPLAARPVFTQTCSVEDKTAVKRSCGLQRPFILCVGNIEPRKNLVLLLDAYRRLSPPDTDLVFVGRRGWLAGDFLREVRKQCFKGKVHILGYLPEASLAALYQTALVFAYPSKLEGFGLPVLEAMASGTAVLTSRIEPLASMVGEAGWLADPQNTGEWLAALEEILHDRDERQARAALGKERSGGFSWAKAASKTIGCYEEALQGGK